MKGSEIALATLMREEVNRPCLNYSWMTNSSYMSKVAGRDYWSDREGVFFEYLRQCGINLVPQWYFPGEAQRNIELGHMAHEHLPGGTEGIRGPEDIARTVDRLPSDSAVEMEYDIEAAARGYADPLRTRIDRTKGETLFIGSFGQADFMGPYSRWGYENYLIAIMDLGVIGLQGFEEEHGVKYDEIAKLKDRTGRPIGVWGCVSVTSTFPYGTIDDVRQSVERSFMLAGKGRGFVLSSTSSIMPEVPHENIDVFFDHGREFGREFLS